MRFRVTFRIEYADDSGISSVHNKTVEISANSASEARTKAENLLDSATLRLIDKYGLANVSTERVGLSWGS